MAQSREIKEIGQIIYEKASTTIGWKIYNFFALSQKIGKVYNSPDFSFLDLDWYLELVPNGVKHSVGSIGLYLCTTEYLEEMLDINFTLGIQNGDGSIYDSWSTEYEFQGDDYICGTDELVQKTSILEDAHEITPDGHLIFFCVLKYKGHDRDLSSSDSEDEDANDRLRNNFFWELGRSLLKEVETRKQKESFDGSAKSDTSRDTRNTRYLHPSSRPSRKENGTQTEKEPLPDAADDYFKDMKDLLVSERFCDVKIVVKDKELQAHKAILAARSSVFSAMFEHQMTEKNSNTVEILDCEFDVFKEFLHYLYTGKVQEVSETNVCEVYVLADKYDIKQLKGECIATMNNSISVDNFCGIICLAVKFNDSELVKKATDYFFKNAKNILQTVEWQSFVAENPTVANELFLKIVT